MKEKIKNILENRPWRRIDGSTALTPAAVLVPLFCKEGAVHTLFTRRTDTVRHHKGQISFPGGAVHSEDRDLADTALRETYEEVGIKPEDVEVLGKLDQSRTITDYVITPFVGVIPHPYRYVVSPIEVDEIIEVPLSFIFDESNLDFGPFNFEGVTLYRQYYRYDGAVIWGATLRILDQLKESLGSLLARDQTCVP